MYSNENQKKDTYGEITLIDLLSKFHLLEKIPELQQQQNRIEQKLDLLLEANLEGAYIDFERFRIFIGISKSTGQRMRDNKEISYIQFGRKILIEVAEVNRWLKHYKIQAEYQPDINNLLK